MKKEFKINETFQCGLIKVKCIKSDGTCKGCVLENIDCRIMDEESINNKIFGSCYRENRNDKTDVIFVKVDE